DDRDRAALQILDRLDRAVVLDHVGGAEPLLAGGLERYAGDDLHVQPLGAREDHGEARRRPSIDLPGEEGLEALGVGLEEDLLELVALALAGREVGTRAHQPQLLLGGEAAAEADERGGLRDRLSAEKKSDKSEKGFHGVLLDVVGVELFPVYQP